MNRRRWIASAGVGTLAWGLCTESSLLAKETAQYHSPYRLRYRHPRAELEVGFRERPWSNIHEETTIAGTAWYGREVKHKYGAWGPPARQYPAAPQLANRPMTWLQDRVILTAARWIGTAYQHHHVPDWDPPADWPWLKVAYGRNSRGIDCSNFSSFYYNYGLGIKLDTGIRTQAQRRTVRGPGGRGVLQIERLEPMPYAELVQTLQPADLLYIKNNAGQLAHVILWLGEVGVSPDGVPLVIDSTGSGHKDSSGNPIPIGVHIRPFSERSWYAKDFSHAHRILGGISRLGNGEVDEAAEGGAADFPENAE